MQESKSIQLFIFMEKNKASLIYCTSRGFHIFGFTFTGPKEVCRFLPFRDQKLPEHPPLNYHPFHSKGAGLLRGNRPGYYGLFMVPSCVV